MLFNVRLNTTAKTKPGKNNGVAGLENGANNIGIEKGVKKNVKNASVKEDNTCRRIRELNRAGDENEDEVDEEEDIVEFDSEDEAELEDVDEEEEYNIKNKTNAKWSTKIIVKSKTNKK
uniref:Uncharacterized protein n=1 Tax=Cacopsylla melanoneura TaxID=428564 RepID=A0A8D8WJ35_9HEMI